MEASDRLIDIIEDHESLRQTLGAINVALEENLPMPIIPTLNDLVLTDILGKICERLNNGRDGKQV